MPTAPARHTARPRTANKPGYHRLYDRRRWRDGRLRFLDDHPSCAMCEAQGVIRPATQVDHKKPHRGDEALFWDETNWQPLCEPHHAAKSAAEGNAGRAR